MASGSFRRGSADRWHAWVSRLRNGVAVLQSGLRHRVAMFLWLLFRRLRGVLGRGETARQSLVALGLNSSTSLVAGAFLGAITETFAALPGLLVLVPAAIGLRGNIFSALGSRVSTAIHVGEFELSARADGVLVQNIAASMILTLAMSAVLAVVAKVVAVALDVPNTISIVDLAMISIVGGVLANSAKS